MRPSAAIAFIVLACAPLALAGSIHAKGVAPASEPAGVNAPPASFDLAGCILEPVQAGKSPGDAKSPNSGSGSGELRSGRGWPFDAAPAHGAASPRSPKSPASPSSPRSAPACLSTGKFRVNCGSTTDACNGQAPTFTAELVSRHSELVAGMCTVVEDHVPVQCGEIVTMRQLAPLCPAAPPRPASSANTSSRVVAGQDMWLQVTAVDGCGNVSAACISKPTLCVPVTPVCTVPVCTTDGNPGE